MVPLLWAAHHGTKVLSSLLGGDLSDRLGRKRLIVSGWFLYAAVYAGFAFVSNIASLFNQQSRRLPDEDGLTVSRGLIGTYPNAFYRVAQQDLPEFIAAVAGLTGEADYRKLAERFAVRRTSQDFWSHSDKIHEIYRRIDPLGAGLLDYNRLENR